MKFICSIFVLLLSVMTLGHATEPFNTEQKTAIEGVVHDYLVKNPEILLEVTKALQQKQQKEMLQRAQAAIPKEANRLFNAKVSPVLGDAKGAVALVVFSDYQCIHCRQMGPILNRLIEENPHVRFVFKEFPIFGEVSEFAAKAAFAAALQGKYHEFHKAMMAIKPPVDQEKILAAAQSVQLDKVRLEAIMKAKQSMFEEELKQNMELAQSLGVMGTPAFVIAGHIDQGEAGIKAVFVPGVASFKVLQNLIHQVAKKS